MEISSVKGVLESIIENTIERNRKGMYDFVDRGINHAIFPSTVPLETSLVSLYGKGTAGHASLSSFAQEVIHHKTSDDVTERLNEMIQHCSVIDSDASANTTKLAEECEREMESEELKENEEETQASREEPFSECDWQFEHAFSNPIKLFAEQVFISVKEQIRQKLKDPDSISDLGSVNWSTALYCTQNFWKTIVSRRSPKKFLRPVNSFLSWPCGRVVLLSEYEANKLLEYFWKIRESGATRWTQMNQLSLADRGSCLGADLRHVPSANMASMKLFRGCSAFLPAEKYHLRVVFKGLQAASLAREILSMRERIRFFERSDLESFALENEEEKREVEGGLVTTYGTEVFPFPVTKDSDPHDFTIPFQVTAVMDGFHCTCLQSITAMDRYSSKSFEELRYEDFGKRSSTKSTTSYVKPFIPFGGSKFHRDRQRNIVCWQKSFFSFFYNKPEMLSVTANDSIGSIDGGTFSIGSAPKQGKRPNKGRQPNCS